MLKKKVSRDIISQIVLSAIRKIKNDDSIEESTPIAVIGADSKAWRGYWVPIYKNAKAQGYKITGGPNLLTGNFDSVKDIVDIILKNSSGGN